LKKARSYAIMKHPGKLRIKVSVNLVIKRPEPAEIKHDLKLQGFNLCSFVKKFQSFLF